MGLFRRRSKEPEGRPLPPLPQGFDEEIEKYTHSHYWTYEDGKNERRALLRSWEQWAKQLPDEKASSFRAYVFARLTTYAAAMLSGEVALPLNDAVDLLTKAMDDFSRERGFSNIGEEVFNTHIARMETLLWQRQQGVVRALVEQSRLRSKR